MVEDAEDAAVASVSTRGKQGKRSTEIIAIIGRKKQVFRCQTATGVTFTNHNLLPCEVHRMHSDHFGKTSLTIADLI